MFNEMGITTLAMTILFGTNALLFLLFHIVARQETINNSNNCNNKGPPHFGNDNRTAIEKGVIAHVGKKLSKPFNGTVECFVGLTSELFRVGCIMALTYLCENYPLFDHSKKSYSRDAFLFILVIFFGYALLTIKPTSDLSLLGREQTEEWKGWMQFIFLLYHYFHAEEVYNSVRCMITCYVWMTGFGNFSFFYIKQDFGWLRVVQMLWRLNFSVLLLMWTHGNTYILYYICPLHTFYFLLTYSTMYAFSSTNHTKWGIRVKLVVVVLLILILWDINGGLFDIIFAFLGTNPSIGATRGGVWEWYFRTSLDKYSTFLGMIFALNYPICEQFFTKAKGGPIIITAIVLASATIWWVITCYSQPKLEYNQTHSYMSFVPILSYIFFRNITPYVRSGISMSLHELGKTTLETYLLQHHIWLTSNAKTLLTLVPDHPWMNFALTTIIFFLVSRELYRLTMSLRGMLLPDDVLIAWRNLIGMIVGIVLLFLIAAVLYYSDPQWFDVMIGIASVFIGIVLIINRFSSSVEKNNEFQKYNPRFCGIASVFIIFGLAMQFSQSGLPAASSLASRTSHSLSSFEHEKEADLVPNTSSNTYSYDLQKCYIAVCRGHWDTRECDLDEKTATAMCQLEIWDWDNSDCPISMLSQEELQFIYRNKKIAFFGDSIIRNIYQAFNVLLTENYTENSDANMKHRDQKFISVASNTTVHFFWTPFSENITEKLYHVTSGEYDIILMGSAAWNALHGRSLEKYSISLRKLKEQLSRLVGSSYTIWMQPTTILDGRLNTPEKQKYMTESIIDQYRSAYKNSALAKLVEFTINPAYATATQESSSVDGVHYSAKVSQVLSQMISNAYLLKHPKALSLTSKQDTTAWPTSDPNHTMGHPLHGLGLLFFSVIMIYFMDNFFGVGALSLAFFGRYLDWNAAYIPLLNKIGVIRSEQVYTADTDIEGNVDRHDDSSSVPLIDKDAKEKK